MKQNSAVKDTTSCKHHAMSPTGMKMDSAGMKMDSSSCKHEQICAAGAGMSATCCPMHQHGCLFLAAISFLVLAIALILISNSCCCCKCCNCKECNCETKEEKKE
jgi:hypothetical protein